MRSLFIKYCAAILDWYIITHSSEYHSTPTLNMDLSTVSNADFFDEPEPMAIEADQSKSLATATHDLFQYMKGLFLDLPIIIDGEEINIHQQEDEKGSFFLKKGSELLGNDLLISLDNYLKTSSRNTHLQSFQPRIDLLKKSAVQVTVRLSLANLCYEEVSVNNCIAGIALMDKPSRYIIAYILQASSMIAFNSRLNQEDTFCITTTRLPHFIAALNQGIDFTFCESNHDSFTHLHNAILEYFQTGETPNQALQLRSNHQVQLHFFQAGFETAFFKELSRQAIVSAASTPPVSYCSEIKPYIIYLSLLYKRFDVLIDLIDRFHGHEKINWPQWPENCTDVNEINPMYWHILVGNRQCYELLLKYYPQELEKLIFSLTPTTLNFIPSHSSNAISIGAHLLSQKKQLEQRYPFMLTPVFAKLQANGLKSLALEFQVEILQDSIFGFRRVDLFIHFVKTYLNPELFLEWGEDRMPTLADETMIYWQTFTDTQCCQKLLEIAPTLFMQIIRRFSAEELSYIPSHATETTSIGWHLCKCISLGLINSQLVPELNLLSYLLTTMPYDSWLIAPTTGSHAGYSVLWLILTDDNLFNIVYENLNQLKPALDQIRASDLLQSDLAYIIAIKRHRDLVIDQPLLTDLGKILSTLNPFHTYSRSINTFFWFILSNNRFFQLINTDNYNEQNPTLDWFLTWITHAADLGDLVPAERKWIKGSLIFNLFEYLCKKCVKINPENVDRKYSLDTKYSLPLIKIIEQLAAMPDKAFKLFLAEEYSDKHTHHIIRLLFVNYEIIQRVINAHIQSPSLCTRSQQKKLTATFSKIYLKALSNISGFMFPTYAFNYPQQDKGENSASILWAWLHFKKLRTLLVEAKPDNTDTGYIQMCNISTHLNWIIKEQKFDILFESPGTGPYEGRSIWSLFLNNPAYINYWAQLTTPDTAGKIFMWLAKPENFHYLFPAHSNATNLSRSPIWTLLSSNSKQARRLLNSLITHKEGCIQIFRALHDERIAKNLFIVPINETSNIFWHLILQISSFRFILNHVPVETVIRLFAALPNTEWNKYYQHSIGGQAVESSILKASLRQKLFRSEILLNRSNASFWNQRLTPAVFAETEPCYQHGDLAPFDYLYYTKTGLQFLKQWSFAQGYSISDLRRIILKNERLDIKKFIDFIEQQVTDMDPSHRLQLIRDYAPYFINFTHITQLINHVTPNEWLDIFAALTEVCPNHPCFQEIKEIKTKKQLLKYYLLHFNNKPFHFTDYLPQELYELCNEPEIQQVLKKNHAIAIQVLFASSTLPDINVFKCMVVKMHQHLYALNIRGQSLTEYINTCNELSPTEQQTRIALLKRLIASKKQDFKNKRQIFDLSRIAVENKKDFVEADLPALPNSFTSSTPPPSPTLIKFKRLCLWLQNHLAIAPFNAEATLTVFFDQNKNMDSDFLALLIKELSYFCAALKDLSQEKTLVLLDKVSFQEAFKQLEMCSKALFLSLEDLYSLTTGQTDAQIIHEHGLSSAFYNLIEKSNISSGMEVHIKTLSIYYQLSQGPELPMKDRHGYTLAPCVINDIANRVLYYDLQKIKKEMCANKNLIERFLQNIQTPSADILALLSKLGEQLRPKAELQDHEFLALLTTNAGEALEKINAFQQATGDLPQMSDFHFKTANEINLSLPTRLWNQCIKQGLIKRNFSYKKYNDLKEMVWQYLTDQNANDKFWAQFLNMPECNIITIEVLREHSYSLDQININKFFLMPDQAETSLLILLFTSSVSFELLMGKKLKRNHAQNQSEQNATPTVLEFSDITDDEIIPPVLFENIINHPMMVNHLEKLLLCEGSITFAIWYFLQDTDPQTNELRYHHLASLVLSHILEDNNLLKTSSLYVALAAVRHFSSYNEQLVASFLDARMRQQLSAGLWDEFWQTTHWQSQIELSVYLNTYPALQHSLWTAEKGVHIENLRAFYYLYQRDKGVYLLYPNGLQDFIHFIQDLNLDPAIQEPILKWIDEESKTCFAKEMQEIDQQFHGEKRERQPIVEIMELDDHSEDEEAGAPVPKRHHALPGPFWQENGKDRDSPQPGNSR